MNLEDKLLALFGAGGAAVFVEQFLSASQDPKLQAGGALLVAIGALLKAVIPAPKSG